MSIEDYNIMPHKYKVTQEDREKIKNQKARLIWFTGLSGSGKSTIANVLEHELFKKGCHTYSLDGDNIRNGINKGLDFSEEGRHENLRRIGEIAKLFLDAGIIVIAAFVSPFESDRKKIKQLVGEENYLEVFVDCPLSICEERDVKGLYAKARKGLIKNFTGIDSPYERPKNADLVIKSDQMEVEEAIAKILKLIES